MKAAIRLAVFFCFISLLKAEPPEIGEPVDWAEQPECIVKVLKVSDVFEGFPALRGNDLVPSFWRSVEVVIENLSDSSISVRCMDAKNLILMHRLQIWNGDTKSWPPLLDFGAFENNGSNLSLVPHAKRRFSISIPAAINNDLTEPIPEKFRIAVFLSNKDGKKTVAYTDAVILPNAKSSHSSPDRAESK